ncbi:unnamed protein product [Protopolystoma xenopodis]|uniref:Uncharacterized protein n=1 Tax=Protopolystoma xenopodis TaxID=117903 RepID=A0A3S5BKF9_9PLAT|nr:unnamed protein product [Protopolystoma xenopodis]
MLISLFCLPRSLSELSLHHKSSRVAAKRVCFQPPYPLSILVQLLCSCPDWKGLGFLSGCHANKTGFFEKTNSCATRSNKTARSQSTF